MVTIATNLLFESMRQRVSCMGAFHSNPQFVYFNSKLLNVGKIYSKDLLQSPVMYASVVGISNRFVTCLRCRETAEFKLKHNISSNCSNLYKIAMIFSE